MQIGILENTDVYALCQYGDKIGFSMFDKRRSKSFFVGGAEAAGFFEYYRNSLVAWGTEGSTYFNLSKNQVLAQVFNMYSHRHMDDNLAPSDYMDHAELPVGAVKN
jgi:hypothetical protein